MHLQPTLLANTWMAAHLPHTKYLAVLCCAGSAGESAFRNSLDDAFAEASYVHQPKSVHLRRPPLYYVVGTVFDEGDELAAFAVRRIAR